MADRSFPDQNLHNSLIVVSSADGKTPVSLWADPTTHALVTSGGGSGGGGAVTVADGADIAQGATTDAAVTAGSAGTISGKLRQISADISTSNSLMSTAANQTNGTQQTKITDGTNLLSVPTQGSTTASQTGTLGMAAVTTGSPSYTTGQTSPLSMSTSGNLRVTVGTGSATIGNVGSSTATGIATPANAFFIGASDGTNLQPLRVALADATSSTSLLGVSAELYNGSNNDRTRNNTTGVVIAAGATSSNAGVLVTTYNASKVLIVVNIATATAATLTVAINGITSSGYSYPILTSTALATVAVTPLRIFPGSTATANSVSNDVVPRTLQIVTTVTGTISYGIDYELSV